MAGTVLRSGPISSTVWHDSPSDGTFALESVQDVQDIVDLNKAQFNAIRRGEPFRSETNNHIARVGMVQYMELLRKGIIDLHGDGDYTRFDAWLKENSVFRTRPGTP